MELNRELRISRCAPQSTKILRLIPTRQAFRGIGVNAEGDDLARVPINHFLQTPRSILPITEQEADALQSSAPDPQAVLQVTKVILIRFRMHNYRVLDPGARHTAQ